MNTDTSDLEAQLVAKIIESFSGSFPRPERVTNYRKSDPEDYDGVAQSVEDFYEGSSWDTINLSNVGGYVIAYLNREALLHYLPAFLIKILCDHRPHTDFTDRFFSVFGDLEYWGQNKQKLVEALSQEQQLLVYDVCTEVRVRTQHYYSEYQLISQMFGTKC